MDNGSYIAMMASCRKVAGFLVTVDFDELEDCAEQRKAPEIERYLIAVLGDTARRLPKGSL